MKIIKQGDLKRIRCVKRFVCSKCGCIFEADNTEYKDKSDNRNDRYVVTDCPTCKNKVYMYK